MERLDAGSVPATALVRGSFVGASGVAVADVDALFNSSLTTFSGVYVMGFERLTRRAEARKKIDAKNKNARSALKLLQLPFPAMPCQFQILPQLGLMY